MRSGKSTTVNRTQTRDSAELGQGGEVQLVGLHNGATNLTYYY